MSMLTLPSPGHSLPGHTSVLSRISSKDTSACVFVLGQPAELTGWYSDSWLLAARCFAC